MTENEDKKKAAAVSENDGATAPAAGPSAGEDTPQRWYVMRDLTRPNAKMPAYKQLEERHFEVFTPMPWRVKTQGGRRVREKVPFLHDLLFVRGLRAEIDPVVDQIKTLQYRYVRGSYCLPMVVPDWDMRRFIYAVSVSDRPVYFQSGELTPSMYGRQVKIIGGLMDGYQGRLVSIRGSRVKRLLVDLTQFCSVAVEVQPEYIQLIK